MDIIHNMRVVITDDYYYLQRSPDKCLQVAEKEKKNKYTEACVQNFWNFYLFFCSVNGLLGMEYKASMKRIASHLVETLWQPYSWMCRYVNSRSVIIMMQAIHR